MATDGKQEDVVCSLVEVGTIELEDARQNPLYSSLVVLSSEELIVTDIQEWKLRLYRCQDGKLLAISQKLETWPNDVCLINDTEVATILVNGQIEIMSVNLVAQPATITPLRTLFVTGKFDYFYGVRHLKFTDNLLVIGRNLDSMYWGIVSLNDGLADPVHRICKYWEHGEGYLDTSPNNATVYICTACPNSRDNGVYGFDVKTVKMKFVYSRRDLNYPTGISVDRSGFIYVSNANPPCIHQLSDAGKLMTVHSEGIPPFPWLLYWERQKGELFITGWGSNVVRRFRPGNDGGLLNRLKRKILAPFQKKPLQKHSQASACPMPVPSTSDTDRFMRIAYLLVDIGSQVLRQFLSHHVSTVTSNLDQYLASNMSTINNLRKMRVLNNSQYDILFPPNGDDTKLDDYDITLLLTLLHNIIPSLTGQEKSMMQSLRDDRNKLYGHAKSCKMNASDYETCWKSISSTLMTLSQQCGDNNFKLKIVQEIKNTQVSGIPAGLNLDIIRTWFNRIETVEESLERGYFAKLTRTESALKDILVSEQVKEGRKERKTKVKKELERKTEGKEKELPSDFNMDQVVDIKLVNFMKENTFRGIGEMYRDRRYPAKDIMTYAVKECGYNKDVKCLLSRMSNLLRKKLAHATRVWCGYRLHNPYTPIFVASLCERAHVPDMSSLPKTFHNYEIVYRYEHKPSNEETFISEQLEGNKSTIPEDAERVLDCIARNAGRLMHEHSNLCIITASCVKAIGFNGCYSSLKLSETICIVLYVPVKGIIPIGEKEFPNDIEGIVTDVREGEFVFHVGNRAGDKLPKLRMGCCISTKNQLSGTLGGFIDLPGDKIGCITAAHVILGEEERQEYHRYTREQKRTYNVDLTTGKKMIEIYQPSPTNSDAFGKVSQIVFEEGNESTPSVDVAVIEMTDDSRRPDAGIFPLDISSDIADIGLTKEQPLEYASGKIREHLIASSSGCVVLKYGSSSGITCGQLVWNGACVRTVNIPGKSWDSVDETSDPCFFNQWVVKALGKRKLSKPGDSGALVFICNSGSIRDLEAIGLLVGGTTNQGIGRMYIVTPIKTVFEQLGLSSRSFKSFPGTVPAEEIIYSRQIVSSDINLFKESQKNLQEQIQEQKETLTMLSENFAKLDEKLDTKLSEKAREIQDELKNEMKANTASLEQKMQIVIKDEMKANAIALEEKMIGILSRFIGLNHPS